MKKIELCKMTNELCRVYYRGFVPDPVLYMDEEKCVPYIFSEEKCDATVERHARLGRIYMAVMLEGCPIGELIFKNIDREGHVCTLSIHLQNNSVKNKGYGTQAERIGLRYAFCDMDMKTVYADALHKNSRSKHVLEKVGFVKTHQDGLFQYYRCDRQN